MTSYYNVVVGGTKMTINKIDVDENKVTLSFGRHEITIIRRALSSMYEKLTEEGKFLCLEVDGVDDILKDGNFTRFLSFHRNLVENEIKEIKNSNQ